MNMWAWLSTMPLYFQIGLPVGICIGSLVVVYKILHRKIRITKAGITVDKIDGK